MLPQTIPFLNTVCRIHSKSFINFIKIALTRFYHLEVMYVMYPHIHWMLKMRYAKWKIIDFKIHKSFT